MVYAHNGHLDEKTRIEVVSEDILTDYPNLLEEDVKKIASMEEPIIGCHEDESQFYPQEIAIYRLVNIMNVTKDKNEYAMYYQKAYKELLETFEIWRNNFTYANPQDQYVYPLVIYTMEYYNRNRGVFPTLGEVKKELREKWDKKEAAEKYKRDHTMKYSYNGHMSEEDRINDVSIDILREYPALGKEKAEEVASMEEPIIGCHEDESQFYSQEIAIFRLINIMAVTKDVESLKDVYNRASEDIKQQYSSWESCFTYANPQQQIAYQIMVSLAEYEQDNTKEFPTYKSIKQKVRGETDKNNKK